MKNTSYQFRKYFRVVVNYNLLIQEIQEYFLSSFSLVQSFLTADFVVRVLATLFIKFYFINRNIPVGNSSLKIILATK